MAMLYCAQKVFSDIFVFHVRHDMRDASSTQKDVDTISEYCKKNRIDFEMADVKLKDEDSEFAPSENDYRIERYEKILNAAHIYGYKYVATAHHADDQLETILMKICRGTGLKGLSGIARNLEIDGVNFVRPLLDCTKQSIYEICNNNHITYVEDETNSCLDYDRNRIRAEVIPVLREIFPQCALHSTQLSTLAISTQKLVDRVVNQLQIYQDTEFSIKIEALLLAEDVVVFEWLRKTCLLKDKSLGFDAIGSEQFAKILNAIKSRKKSEFRISQDIKVGVSKDIVEVK